MSSHRSFIRNPRDRFWYVNYAQDEEHVRNPDRYFETVYVFIPFPGSEPQSMMEILTTSRRQVHARNYLPQATSNVTDPRGGMILALRVQLRLKGAQREEAIRARADEILSEIMEEEGWDSEDEAAERAAERA